MDQRRTIGAGVECLSDILGGFDCTGQESGMKPGTWIIFLLFLLAGCSTTQVKPDTDLAIEPGGSGAQVEIEEQGDLVCVTENGDPATRTCVPWIDG